MRHFLCAALVAAAPGVLQAQEGTVPVPPNVVVDGVPAIPQTVANALTPYATFRFATMVAWHPLERKMMVLTATTGSQQLHLVDAPGSAPVALTSFPQSLQPVASYDPADGKSFVFVRDTSGGKELYQLYRFDVATGAVTLVTDGTSRNQWAVWAHKGKWVAYHSNRRNPGDFDIHVVRPDDPKTDRLVAEVKGVWRVTDWSPDDSALLVYEDSGSSQSRLWRMDVKTGDKKLLTTDKGDSGQWFLPRYSADGKAIYAIGGDRNSDVQGLWRLDLRSGRWTRATSAADQVDAFDLSPDGKLAAIAYHRQSTSVLGVVELPSMRPRQLPELPVGVISNLSWRNRSREIGFSFGSPTTFRDVYSVDLATNAVSRWTRSETGFDASTLPPPQIIQWKSFDGRMISGILYKPPATFQGPRPVIINIHGGPVFEERPRFIGRSNYFINEDGIALIYPNVRGSGGFGRMFERLDDGVKREDAIKDIGALLDWIATQPGLDKDRVMLTGASYGGYLTLAAAEAYNDRIRCAFAAAAITNFITFMENTAPIRLEDRRAEYGDERDAQMREFLTRMSPITNVARITKPVAIAQAGHDTRVPVEQGEQMVKALRAGNVPVWYVLYKDEGHDGFPSSTAINNFNQYVWILFVDKYLLSPAP